MPVPSSGTFRIYPRTVTIVGGTWQIGAGGTGKPIATPADMLAQLEFPGVDPRFGGDIGIYGYNNFVAGTPITFIGEKFELKFTLDTTRIAFNPSSQPLDIPTDAPIDLLSAEFPSGFLATALEIVIYFEDASAPSWTPNRLVHNLIDAFTMPAPPSDDIKASGVTSIIGNGIYEGITQIFGDVFGLYFTSNNEAISATGVNVWFAFLRGDYILWSASLTLTPEIVIPENPLLSPSTEPITITDGESKLLEIENLFAYYQNADGTFSAAIPITDIMTHTAGTIIFTLPSFAIPLGAKIIIVGTGTQFSGQVELGSFLTILVNGSGIYTLVPGQKHDTYYNRDVSPVTTINVTIPTPKFKTGYFGG